MSGEKCMAINFTAIRYRSLGATTGTPGDFAYIGRCNIYDDRLGRPLNFIQLGADLVYSELRLPAGAPAEFADLAYFANANDAAEMRRVRGDIGQRLRVPQTGAALVIALPSDEEVSLDEASEIGWTIADAARMDHRLGVYMAIHDPAMIMEGACNRHAHAFLVLREIDKKGFAAKKLRDGIALVRTGTTGASFVAEGVRWPDVTWEGQRTKLLEFGLDLTVDPMAVQAQRHVAGASLQRDPQRLNKHRAAINKANLLTIHGEPAALLNGLLRRRSSLEVAELRRFIDKHIDSSSERDAAMNRIFCNASVVTLADKADPHKPRFVTTSDVDLAIESAVDLVDRSRRATETILATVGINQATVVAKLSKLMRDRFTDLPERPVLVIGNRHTDCDHLIRALELTQAKLASIQAVIVGCPGAERGSPRIRVELPKGGLVVIPRSETVRDQDLATLLDLAQLADAVIILGKDLSYETGIVTNRLATYAASQLTSSRDIEEQVRSPDQLLRAGLVAQAIKLMQHNLRIAMPTEREGQDFDFVVCTSRASVNKANRILAVNDGVQRRARGERPITAYLAQGATNLWSGQHIVFERTDYSALPPRIRQGQLATIASFNRRTSNLYIRLSDGSLTFIRPTDFPWFRPAYALKIGEARQLKRIANLRIEIEHLRHGWAALLLAARHMPTVSVVIDRRLAKDMSAFALALVTTLPGALPPELRPVRDHNAEISQVFDKITSNYAFEVLPEPTHENDRLSSSPPLYLAEAVRNLVASDPHAKIGFRILRERLHPARTDRNEVVAYLKSARVSELTIYLIDQLLQSPTPRSSDRDGDDEEWDMPPELARENPRQWTALDLDRLKVELALMTISASDLYINPDRPGSLEPGIRTSVRITDF